jgi:hypothetical protein
MRLRSLMGLGVILAVLGHSTPASAQQGGLWWSYGVKFVCGLQGPSPLPGEPPVKPGNYATEINIHNPFYTPNGNEIRKKVVFLVKDGQPIGREPQQQGPAGLDGIVLGPDFATMDDCNRIFEIAGMPVPPVMPLTIGYLVLLSRQPLDVDAVYTALPVSTTAQPSRAGIAIDVERVEGRQVDIPTGLFPGGPDILKPEPLVQ